MTGSIGSGSGVPAAPADPIIAAAAQGPVGSRAGRMPLILGGAILAVALVSVLAIVALPRPAATYPAGTPEAAFKAYYSAWQQRDLETSYALLSDRLRDQVTIVWYRQMDRDYGWGRDQDRRLTLQGSRVGGDTATLDLRIEVFYSGGLLGGGGTSAWDTSVPLVREHGAWHVDELLAGLDPMPAPEKG
jgi:hypothetical protein